MRGGEQEAISPELVLVMPPAGVRRALEALQEVVLYDPGADRRAAVAEAERAGEAERATEAETERVAAGVTEGAVAEARRVAAAEAGRVAVAEVERADEAERVAGRERAEAEVERASEAERVAEAEHAEAETEPSFELVESSIRPSAPSPPAQPPNPDEEWSYPSRRPTLRSSLLALALALALGAVAFGGGMLVQKKFVSDQTTSIARIGSPETTASAALSSPAMPATGHSSKSRPSSRPRTEARTRAATSARSKQGKAAASGFVPARVWIWTPRPGARSYLVRFFLNNRQVFSGRSDKIQLVLPHGFRYHAGRYRWLVTATPHLAQPIVDATFVLSARSAGAANR
jgi:hypothetical protein